MKIRITKRAEQRVRAIDARWRKHADYPNLFREELDRAWEQLAASPKSGRFYGLVGRRKMYQLLLQKTRQWIYYSVDEKAGVITVHMVWGTPRGTEPKL